MTDSASETLFKLRREFTEQLPSRLEAIRSHFERLCSQGWQVKGAQSLHRLVHNLTGSAGSHGLASLSAVARDMESRLSAVLKGDAGPDEVQWQVLTASFEALQAQIETAQGADAPDLLPPELPGRNGYSPLVCVVEDDTDQLSHMGQILEEAGYRVELFTSADAAHRACLAESAQRPDAVILDVMFPEGEDAGNGLLNDLPVGKEHGIPVIMVSARDDLPARLAALRAGACRYLNKPYDSGQLIEMLDVVTCRQTAEPYRVLLVDDDLQFLEHEAAVLRAGSMEVQTLSEPLKTLEVVDSFNPDIVVLDVHMPDASGPELAAVLRERHSQLQMPILFLSSETDMSQQLLALNLGGDDFLVKPVEPEHFISAVTARVRRARQNRGIQQRFEMTLYEREREHRALNKHAIVSIADAKGNITHVNDKFCEVSGYRRDELIGQNHRIVKSDKHPADFYRELWRSITRGQTWQGEICNQRKDGSYYWVYSTITPFLGDDGKPYQYVSIRTDITEVKEHEERLQASEEKFRTLSQNIPGMVYRGYADWSVEYITNSTGLCGYSPVELNSDDANWLALIHPDDKQKVLEESSELNNQPCSLIQEYRITRKDGELRWVSDYKQSVFNKQGDFTYVDGVVFDVTARKTAEEDIQHHKERLRRGQMFANIGTWEWNIVTGELYWSERIGPLFGYSEGDVETTYENFLAAVHPDDRQAVIDAVNACVEDDVPYEIEHRVVWQDGTVRWLLERGAVVHDDKGRPLQMLGVVQDVDDRKRTELALSDSERQLREAQQMAHIGSWQANLVSGELVWSDEIYRIFGYEPGAITPSVEAFHRAVHPDDLARVRESEKQAERTGRHDVVHRIVLPDGSIRHVHELAVSETNDKGELVRLTGTVQDITENVEAHQALVTARDEAERANKAKSEFLSSMSHELRTPMNAILGFGQLLDFDEQLQEAQRENVKEILRAGNHLLELINEVLDLAKIEAGSIALSLEPVEFCPILKECLALVSTLADKKDISISHAGMAGVVVRADAMRLKQALINILSNAIKYNRQGGSVHVSVQRSNNDRLRINITDTGPGIPADRIDELFQPFNRLDAENTDVEGTGIGLTLMHRIIEMMGGNVGVKSEVGVGSTFWIELPIESMPEAEEIEAGSEKQQEDTSAVNTSVEIEKQYLVLYIEDNPMNLKLVSQLLARREHIHLLTAPTPELGIELALTRQPELILLDINLPGMNGYEILEVFKASPELDPVPVVALTANAMTSDVERGKQAGFADYLTKPLDIRHFLATVDALLGFSDTGGS